MLEALEVEVAWLLDNKEQAAEALSAVDIEWAEFVAGRPVTRLEALELKLDYEAWVNEMEEVFG